MMNLGFTAATGMLVAAIFTGTGFFDGTDAVDDQPESRVVAPDSGDAGGGAWLTDLIKAKKQSKASGKPILMDFTGSDWCGWCVKLKKEVFDTAAFRQWAKKNVVLLEVDFPRRKPQDAATRKQNAKLKRRYAVRSFPTVVFADHRGKEIGRTGYRRGGAKAWIAHAETLID